MSTNKKPKVIKAEWIDEDCYIGPNYMHLAIRKGEVREVIAQTEGKVMLRSSNGKGMFGWIKETRIKYL